ncbi:MAG: hypothetical protein QOE27_1964 [Solirubrobacteraceae bacterium]|nr:hypothetical protein [Solirubrobacteraceae bacterium]
MGARLRRSAPSLVIAGAAVAVMSWLGLYGFYWTDYDNEAAPAFAALVHGHLARFVELLPAYGGSLELRAPFALLTGFLGGGEVAVYRVVALPCLLAGAALGVWLVARMRAGGHTRLARGVALGLCVANPLTLRALEIGHPEELLGAVLCVAAVFLAAKDRPLWAGLLLGLAVANKQWALLAAGPVLLALPRGQWRTMLVAGAVAAAFLLPILSVQAGAGASGHLAVAETGAIFNPEQVFWFAGTPGHLVANAPITHRPGFRNPPSWLNGLAHPLIVALGLPLTLLALRRRRPGRRETDALLLLALLFLLRCALDPWDAVYYPLPFVLALLGWEATARSSPPVFSLAASAAVWAVFEWLPGRAGANLISVTSMALALAAGIGLAGALYGRRGSRAGTVRNAGPSARRSPGSPAIPA